MVRTVHSPNNSNNNNKVTSTKDSVQVNDQSIYGKHKLNNGRSTTPTTKGPPHHHPTQQHQHSSQQHREVCEF